MYLSQMNTIQTKPALKIYLIQQPGYRKGAQRNMWLNAMNAQVPANLWRRCFEVTGSVPNGPIEYQKLYKQL